MRAGEPAALPSGTVTLLLGDVEGSTRSWSEHHERMRSSMAELDSVVDELVAKFGGARPVEQGEGDSFVAAFPLATDAISCALELQRRLTDGPLRVRMSVHTGEVLLREGDRYDGPVIIRAARMRDLARGGQVLVSSSTRDLVIDALADGADLVDLGPHALKGLERPERVYQLVHPDLEAEFPPLRSPDVVANNLPIQLTSFIGRISELEELSDGLDESRMVTLTGAGGCGKTRLAIEVAARTSDRYPDGVFFCDLGPVADPEAVAVVVCNATDAPSLPRASEVDATCARLATSRSLVILDNCEHVIDVCAKLVDTILRACPSTTVLATSREPLGVAGEVSWRVPSLATPTRDDSDAAGYDAVQLFVQRAAQARPGFTLRRENASQVAEICRRLEGIPLAIELAAARIRTLSVEQIARGLDDRFRLLGRGARTMLPRQRTLEASVAWSHDLLSDQQRTALRRLSVFAGEFPLEAAEHVLEGDGIERAEVLELVSQLVDRSLVIADGTHMQTRYRVLETIRQFARDRLVESGEARAVAQRHLEFYATFVRDVVRRAPGMSATMDESARIIDDSYDNIREAIEWSIADAQTELGLRLLNMLWGSWVAWRTGARSREAERWRQALLRNAEGVSARTLAVALLVSAGRDEAIGGGGGPDVFARKRRALEIARELGDPRLLGRALERLGFEVGLWADATEGLALLREAVEIARDTDNDALLWQALFSGAQVRMFAGEEAVAEARESVEAAVRCGAGEAWARGALGITLLGAGDVSGSIAELRTSLELFERVDPTWVPKVAPSLAFALALRGETDEAWSLIGYAAPLAEQDQADQLSAMYIVHFNAAWLAMEAGRFEVATQHLAQIPDAGASTSGVPLGWALAPMRNVVAAVTNVAHGADGDARRALEATVEADPGGTWPIHATRLWTMCARVARRLHSINEAESYLVEAFRLASDLCAHVGVADALETLAALRLDIGADVEAARFFGAAQGARRAMGIVRRPDPIFDAEAETAATRQRLGSDAFDAAWAEGEALSIDDAVAFALRGRGPRQRPQAGWDALTPTELKVVALVAEGLSNPQIAERLFISKRTVSTHLSHVFAKVGVASRAELATEATKRGVSA